MDLYEEMRKRGAMQSQLENKTFRMVEDILLSDLETAEETRLDAGRSVANRYINEMNRAETRARLAIRDLNAALDKVNAKADALSGDIKQVETLISDETKEKMRLAEAFYALALPDAKAERTSLQLFRLILQSVKDIYELDDTTVNSDIICKAIEAASYAMWRSIMGPKWSDDGKSVYFK